MTSAPQTNPVRLFIAGTVSFALIGALPGIFGVGIPIYARAFDISLAAAGQIQTAQGVGALFIVLLGLTGLKFLTFRVALGFYVLGALLAALQLNFPLMLTATFSLGIAFGLLAAVVNRRFLNEFGDRGPGMVGLVNGIFGIGAIISPLLVIMAGGSPQFVFLGLAIVALAMIPVVQPSGQAGKGPRGFPDIRHPKFLLLIPIFAVVFIEVGMAGFGPTALIARGATEAEAARLASGFFMTYLVARLILFWLSRFFAVDVLFLIGALGSAILAGVCVIDPSGYAFVAIGFFVGIAFPTYYVWAIRWLGNDPRNTSLILTSSLSAVSLGPLLYTRIISRLGADWLMPAIFVVSIVASLIVLTAVIVARRNQATQSV